MRHADKIECATAPSPKTLEDAPLQGRSGQCVKRNSIICTASRIFYRDGFQGASIDLIASEAGVSRQTIYNHYRDKETLLAAVIDDALENLQSSMFDLLATFPKNGDNLEQRLANFAFQASRNCFHNSQGTLLRRFAKSNGPEAPLATNLCVKKGPANILPPLAEKLSALADQGLLEISDPEMAALHFLALANADVQYSEMAGKPLDDEVFRRSAENGVRTFLRAFGAAKLSA